VLVVSVRGFHHVVRIFNEQGEVVDSIALPGVGTVSDISVDPMSHAVFMAFESYLQPPLILRHDLETGILSVWDATDVPFDFAPYGITHDVVVTSDGASIPITLVHSKDLVLDNSHPTILYGYGGFDVSITPTFSASRLLWLENGGIYAVANIRGGGEFGESWHGAGKGQNKQTVFDDFAAAGDWLIARGYTSCDRLAAVGESNGGLLVAATMLQRPELFAGVICSIPVTDMLRFHRFTIGHYWTFEYGNADDDVEQFRVLHAYSPVHNVRAGVNYPPILVTTGENDDRVVPAHAMKFVAALQDVATVEDGPRLLRYQSDVGHGLGKPRSKVRELDCAIYTFALACCGVAPTGE
jgi:prolyl oligopeptidase